jgi:hypothetical protein
MSDPTPTILQSHPGPSPSPPHQEQDTAEPRAPFLPKIRWDAWQMKKKIVTLQAQQRNQAFFSEIKIN